jgi:hypothetical protein
MVQWKQGVSSEGLEPVMSKALDILEFARKKALDYCSLQEAVITAGKDPGHSANSLHHVGLAIDLRTNDFAQAYAHFLSLELGVGWDVVVEVDHVHVERDPKKSPLERGDTLATSGLDSASNG